MPNLADGRKPNGRVPLLKSAIPDRPLANQRGRNRSNSCMSRGLLGLLRAGLSITLEGIAVSLRDELAGRWPELVPSPPILPAIRARGLMAERGICPRSSGDRATVS